MKISLRILLGYFLLVAIAAWFVLNIFMEEVKPGVRQTTEDALVDTAHVLAQIASQDLQAVNIQSGVLAQTFEQIQKNKLQKFRKGLKKRKPILQIRLIYYTKPTKRHKQNTKRQLQTQKKDLRR